MTAIVKDDNPVSELLYSLEILSVELVGLGDTAAEGECEFTIGTGDSITVGGRVLENNGEGKEGEVDGLGVSVSGNELGDSDGSMVERNE